MNSIEYDLTDAEYRQRPGVSASALKQFRRSPAHYKASVEQPQEPTPAFLVGRYFHHLILTPDQPIDISIRPEGMDGRSKAGKEWSAAHPISITHEDAWACMGMKYAIANHPTASLALKSGRPEVSVFCDYTDPELDFTLQLKSRMDWVGDGSAIIDIKTVEDARPTRFTNNCLEYGWFLQAAFYLRVWNTACQNLGIASESKSEFVFVAVEKAPPYAVKLYAVDQQTIDACEIQINDMLRRWKQCEQTKTWPAYSNDVAIIGQTEWQTRRTLADAFLTETTMEAQ